MTTKALGALITAMGVVAGGLPAEAQGPIRIGASLSLTGTYAKLGRNQHEGYKLCVKDLNTKGGLLGRKVELAAEEAALGVQLLDAELVALVLILAELGVGAGERERGADADRPLGAGRQAGAGEESSEGQTHDGS